MISPIAYHYSLDLTLNRTILCLLARENVFHQDQVKKRLTISRSYSSLEKQTQLSVWTQVNNDEYFRAMTLAF